MSITHGTVSVVLANGRPYIHWKIPNLSNLVSYDRTLSSPYIAYKNTLWRLHLDYQIIQDCIGVAYCETRMKLRISDGNGIELPALRKGIGTFIPKARMKTTYNTYNFQAHDYYLTLDDCKVYRSFDPVTIFVELFDGEVGTPGSVDLPSSLCGKCKCAGMRFLELSQNLKESYINKLYCDFTIRVKERDFLVHKMILAARSPVFAAMMKNDMKESKRNSVNITDCNPEAFHVFLLYLYSGETEKICIENVLDVYSIADKYSVDKLKAQCVEYMKNNLCVDRFCDIIELASSYTESELLNASKQYFVKNSRSIVSAVNWQTFMKENTALASELILLLTPGK